MKPSTTLPKSRNTQREYRAKNRAGGTDCAARVVCLYENLSEIRPFVGRRHPPATPDAPAARSPKIRRSMSNCPAPPLLVDKPTRNGERLTFLHKEKSGYDGGATRSATVPALAKRSLYFFYIHDSGADYRRAADNCDGHFYIAIKMHFVDRRVYSNRSFTF